MSVKPYRRTYTASVTGADARQTPVAGLAAVALQASNPRPAHTLPALVASIRHRSQPIATTSRTRNWTSLFVRTHSCGRTVRTTTVLAL